MNTFPFIRTTLLLAVAMSLLMPLAPAAIGQTVADEIEALRGLLTADRKAVVADAMELTETESRAFWPLYRDYRLEMDKLGDELIKLVLEYADVYPDVPEDRAGKLLKDYLALEKAWVATRAKHLKKLAKVLPLSRVLRFAQLENRLDLALRLQLAGAVPLAPAAPSQP